MHDDEFNADIISEIFDGVSVYTTSFGKIYLKHFNQLETRKLFGKRRHLIEEAVGKGINREEDVVKGLINDGMWSDKEEAWIQDKKKFIASMEASSSKILIPSKRAVHKKLVEKEQEKLDQALHQRKHLVGLTAEKYADNKINRDFFYQITFSDSDLKIPVLRDLDYSEKEKETEIMNIQTSFFKKFSDDNISKAVLSSYYAPYLPFSENPADIFGKSLKDMTTFEIKVISFSRTFLNIFKNCQKEIPEKVARDPEALLEFWESSKNQGPRKTKASEGDGGTTYFGANKDDINQLAQNETAVDLNEEIKKKGGNLNMKQLMEIHGV
jgi:hypothetical protein